MEYGRFDQIDRLKKAGWTEDDECQQLYNDAPDVIGGPTYMRSPDGRIHAVTCGKETPVEGTYRISEGDSPAKTTDYRDGRPQVVQG